MKTKIFKPVYNFCLIFIILFSTWTVINVDAQRTRDLVQESEKVPKTQKRLALVIGNGSYKTSPLRNPVNDANDMATALESVGFEVILHTDINQNKMKRAMSDFGKRLRTNGGTGLFYFAGHGVQVRGKNYLIPIGARVDTEEEVEFEGVDVGRLLAQLRSARNGLNIVILDACRNNPFARSYRSGDKGLASIDAPSGTIIAYATAPGSVASDGDGRNGLYTQELLKQIKTLGISIEDAFKRVRVAVRNKTENKQTPWESSSLTGDFYFMGIVSTKIVPPIVNKTEPIKLTPTIEAGTIRKNSIGMELVYIPSGEFLMGSSEFDIDKAFAMAKRYDKKAKRELFASEAPQHRVYFKKGFWMGKYEVTQGQWEALMDTNISQQKDKAKNANKKVKYKIVGEGANFPIYYVNWNEAKEFIRRLNQKEDGFTYSLPSEAEWEYAARAGTTTSFYWGEDIENLNLCSYANAADKDSKKKFKWKKATPCKDNSQAIQTVGLYLPNNFGLYDMSGNVNEFTEDVFSNGYGGLPIDGSANLKIGNPALRIIRGGSWAHLGFGLRSAQRLMVNPEGRFSDAGFRVVAKLKVSTN